MSEIEKEVIDFYYFKQLSFKEISQQFGINQNTLLSHHRRALKKLRPFYNFANSDNITDNLNERDNISYYNLLKY